MLARLFALVLFVVGTPWLRAHDPGLSTAQVTVRANDIVVNVTFSPTDLAAIKAPSPVPTKWISGLFDLRIAGDSQSAGTASTQVTPDQELKMELHYPRPAAGGASELKALRLDDLPPGHRQFVTVSVDHGPVLAERLLFAREPAITFVLPASAGGTAVAGNDEPATFAAFLKLGVEHIWTGYDHLLFLFGLLIVCARFKSIVAIISCFTVAHSITLALATLNVVNLPSRFVEPMIAASIVFVGVENLIRRGAEPKGRWALTFFFGLIHGFGFASVLRELGVGQGGHGLIMPLFTFNLGVELGQIAVAAIVLPLIWQLRKYENFVRYGVPALSVVVAGAGLYWLLERTVFAG